MGWYIYSLREQTHHPHEETRTHGLLMRVLWKGMGVFYQFRENIPIPHILFMGQYSREDFCLGNEKLYPPDYLDVRIKLERNNCSF